MTARLPFVFSCIGHSFIHLFTAFYFTIVLALEGDWGLPYHDLLELWTPGALLVGLAALPAGWLADRWGAAPMMALFFAGMGAGSIAAGLSTTPLGLLLGLCGVGLFAAIYHPVGIAWLIRTNPGNTGKLLAFNGIFGSLGVGFASMVAGGLIDIGGWRSAFLVPGVISVALGLAMLLCIRGGLLRDRVVEQEEREAPSREDRVRVFLILMLTMTMAGIIYQATQTAMPKLFAERLAAFVGSGTFGIGLVVGATYMCAAFAQLLGGYFADRWPLKLVYIGAWAPQILLLWLAASAGGPALFLVAALMVSFSSGGLPAENLLLARYAPARRHGLAFGAKFVLAFGAGPAAIELVAAIQAATGGFVWLFLILAVGAAAATATALMLPGRRAIMPLPAPITAGE